MKCHFCKDKIETTFLNKVNGTYVGAKKKRIAVCSKCQKNYKEKLLEEL
tara:strand:+ start:309 stop:455 length:147 start_codon:yes stop_codon:yes gene_type:complete